MKLVIGGAYQGKRAFAIDTLGVDPEGIFTCVDGLIDFSYPCIDRLEEFTYSCAKQGMDPVEYFRVNKALWENSVLICQDLSCGVVPMGADMRQWRQATGLLCQYLSREAESVHRIFCGLEHRLK